MGVRILIDGETHPTRTMAVLYCSTTDWAFGPVFTGNDAHGGDERAEAFLRWLDPRKPRRMDDAELANAYAAWLAQEDMQWTEEEAAAEAELWAEDA